MGKGDSSQRFLRISPVFNIRRKIYGEITLVIMSGRVPVDTTVYAFFPQIHKVLQIISMTFTFCPFPVNVKYNCISHTDILKSKRCPI
jgi:hypothetical protein